MREWQDGQEVVESYSGVLVVDLDRTGADRGHNSNVSLRSHQLLTSAIEGFPDASMIHIQQVMQRHK